MKKILTLIILSFLFILGCSTDIEVTVGVDDGYNAFICYDLHYEDPSLDYDQTVAMNKSFTKLQNHYRKTLGFEVENNFDLSKRSWDIILTKRSPAENYREAFNLLEEMLSDESITIFHTLDMAVLEEQYEQAYQLKGTILLNKILQTPNIDQFSLSSINNEIQNSKFRLNVVMPGNEDDKSEAYNSDTLRLFKTDISPTQETEVSFSTKLYIDSGKAQNISLEKAISFLTDRIDFFNIIKWFFTALATFSAVLFILLLLKLKKEKQ